MARVKVRGLGTREKPWVLQAPGTAVEYQMYRDERSEPQALVCIAGSTERRYMSRCIQDLYDMLKERNDWMPLGSTVEQKPAEEGTVEAWARSPGNPVGGWYGLTRGMRGHFAMYIPPLMEALSLAEVTHELKDNRMRAL
ncbi:MAG: hypothetical protein M1434_00930 [Chloroflexi bacterium]|nr:hypothetical protein [Chloroflexota bacterium]MCL5273295.1 hypothetical protein [Chloroflexota bacterium]